MKRLAVLLKNQTPKHNKLRNLVKMIYSMYIFYLISRLKNMKLKEPLVDLTHCPIQYFQGTVVGFKIFKGIRQSKTTPDL